MEQPDIGWWAMPILQRAGSALAQKKSASRLTQRCGLSPLRGWPLALAGPLAALPSSFVLYPEVSIPGTCFVGFCAAWSVAGVALAATLGSSVLYAALTWAAPTML